MRADAYLLGRRKDESTINVTAQPSVVKPGLLAALSKSLLAFLSNITNNSEPRVWQVSDRSGQLVWHVYDPITQQSSSFASEAEVRAWLDQRYYL